MKTPLEITLRLARERFLSEDKKANDDGWTNQYTNQDLERIQKASDYLFRRGMRKKAKYSQEGNIHGTEDLGHGQARRVISVSMRNKKTGKEHEIKAKPTIEKSKGYQTQFKKRFGLNQNTNRNKARDN